MTNKEIAEKLIVLVGGRENIKSVRDCMTRCRFDVFDISKVDFKSIKGLERTLGVVKSGTQIQIIYGLGKASKITQEVKNIIGYSHPVSTEEPVKLTKRRIKEENNIKFKKAFIRIGNIFIPLIPLFISCGLVLAVNNICSIYIGEVYREATIAKIISLIGNSVFSILSILVGVNTAKEFGSRMPMMGGVLGGILMSQSLSDITLFGSNLTPSRGGIISVILVVLIAVLVENIVRKIVPDILDLFLTPLITLVVSVILALFILQPLGGFISDFIGGVVSRTISSDNYFISILSGAVCGGLFLPFVMTGMHQALIPIHADLISSVGYTVLLPVLATSGMAQVGASIAVIRRTKNSELKHIAKSGLIPGFLGVGEPLIYGVTLPLGRPFIGVCLGAAVGGAVMSAFHVGSISMGVSGLPLLFLISNGKVIYFLIGCVVSYAFGYIFTELLRFDDPVE